VHRFFRSLPGLPSLETDTTAAPGAADAAPGAGGADQGQAGQLQCINVRVAGTQASGRGQKRKQPGGPAWKGGENRFVQFVLYKENTDSQVGGQFGSCRAAGRQPPGAAARRAQWLGTHAPPPPPHACLQHALASLGRLLHVSHKVFGTAGTKDKRGITGQWVTAFCIAPERLAGANKCLGRDGLHLGDFSYTSRALRLGDLLGNRSGCETGCRAWRDRVPKGHAGCA
jgi:hypothetical protein